ncbi:MAG: prepilin-type cleavage/methylation domain-containing protein, partial [Pseudomonadota bacterium]
MRRVRYAGLTYLEVVLVVALVGLLIAVAASRLLPYVAEAERIAVLRMEGQLKSALLLEAAQTIARGDGARLSELDGANPMALLLEPPPNYLGELHAPAADELPARSWHFDTARDRLVYR